MNAGVREVGVLGIILDFSKENSRLLYPFIVRDYVSIP